MKTVLCTKSRRKIAFVVFGVPLVEENFKGFVKDLEPLDELIQNEEKYREVLGLHLQGRIFSGGRTKWDDYFQSEWSQYEKIMQKNPLQEAPMTVSF